MPTVIDSLFVELGFNPDKFVEGQKKARDALKSTRDEATKHAKELSSEIGDKLSDAFRKATAHVLEFMGALAGARGIESFVTQTVSAGNALNLMATALGMTPHRLSEFENAVQRSGGTADAAAGSLKRLNDVRLAVRDESAPMPFWMARLGVNLAGARNGEDVLKQLVDRAKDQGRSEQDFVYESGTLGVDTATAEWAYGQGSSKGIDAAIRAQSGTAWTEDQINAANRLKTAWASTSISLDALARNILTDAEPALESLLNWINDIIAKSGPGLAGWIGDKIKDAVKAIENFDWAGFGKGLDGYLDKIQTIIDKISGITKIITGITGDTSGQEPSKNIPDSGNTDKKPVAKNTEPTSDVEAILAIGGELFSQFMQKTFGISKNDDMANLFKNMRGRGIPPDVSENSPLPVKIIGGIPGSSAPDAAGLPTTSEAGPPAPNGGGDGGEGWFDKLKGWLGLKGDDSAAAGTLPTNGSIADVAAGLKAAMPHLTTGECVELAQVMNGVGNVHNWRQGANVMATRPPIGTAVATFGWNNDSKLYAYGGDGTPGIGRDHAGDIAGYDDKYMYLLNQWKGQSPIISAIPWEGIGEKGGKNYSVINNPNGQPAGTNALLLGTKHAIPNVLHSGAHISAHSREHERMILSQSGKTSVQIGALNFSGSNGRAPSNSLDETMARNLFISRADYGLA